MTKERLEFLLKLTDYLHGHWEDPGWGQKPINQLLILVGTHTLTDELVDPEVQAQIQGPVEKAMAEVAMKLIKNAN